MKRLVLTLTTVALFGCVSPAQATSITYTEMFTATGTLGGIPFTNALVTLTMTGDTSDIVGGDTFFYMVAPLAVNVADVWTATFTDTIEVFDNQAPIGIPAGFAGFADRTMSPRFAIMTTDDPAFASYDLGSAIGPVSNVPKFNPFRPFPTTLGDFTLRFLAGNSTFTATTSSVPEPASIVLLATGFLALVGGRFRHRRTTRLAKKTV